VRAVPEGARRAGAEPLTGALEAARVAALVGAAALMGTALAPAPTAAQSLAVELRVGGAVGNYSETDAGLEWVPGASFGGTVAVGVAPAVSAYAGFTRSSFGCEEGFCTGRDVTLTSQGVVVGARWQPGIPWARAGFAWQTLDVESDGGDESVDGGPGFELGAGAAIPVAGIQVTPGLLYRRHGTSSEVEEGFAAALLLEVGLRVPLGGGR
jgi:hypothetical protein